MAEGLLFVLSQPRPGDEPGFHAWYDEEHAPLRLTVPGIHTAERYRAADDARPEWLALYDLDLAALDSPAYRALSRNRSPRERDVMSRLETLDRRVYELTGDHGAPGDGPARVIVVRALSVPASAEADLDAWYTTEHVPALHAIPGWHRTRRYRLREGDGCAHLAVHEISGTDLFATPEYRAATTTVWRDRVMSVVTAAERRVFTHHRSYA